MRIRIISFTDQGQALGERLAQALPGEAMRCGRPMPLDQWTARSFAQAEGLVFVGAAGIAVRAIAPHVRSKTADPAVVVVDEAGRYAVSLLSGHLGGANDLARRIAGICGGEPVITTATDTRGVFAVDQWARLQGCALRNPACIRSVSGKLLAGDSIRMRSDWPIAGNPPPGVTLTEEAPWDVELSLRPSPGDGLRLIPRILVLGVGCRKGIPAEALERAFRQMLERHGLPEEAFCLAASANRKAREPGLLALCETHGLPLETWSPEELQAVQGDFTGSEFVRQITGVDNVCERSAVKSSGGALLISKQAGDGVTMAAAAKPFRPDWRWQYG